MSLTERLKALRARKGWNIRQLALAANVPYPTVWRLEKEQIRNPKLGVLSKLATALEVSLDELVRDVTRQLSNFEAMFPNDQHAEAVFRGYDKLSEQGREQVATFIGYLEAWEKQQQGEDGDADEV